MSGAIALWLGLALIIVAGALFYVERTRPGKLAAWLRERLGR